MENRKPDMASMTQDAMRMWQDVAQMWMGMMTAYWQWPPMAAGRAEPKPKEGSTLPASNGVSNVVVNSQAAMPVQVAVHLSLVEPGTRLSVRPEQVGGAGAIDTVSLSWVTDTLTVELDVPPGLAEGRYWGSIVDDYGRERGTLRVKLGE